MPATLQRAVQGSGAGTAITLICQAQTINHDAPVNFVPYYNNPILTGYGSLANPADTPVTHADNANLGLASGQNNVYSTQLTYNATTGLYEMWYGAQDRVFQTYTSFHDWCYLATNPDPWGNPEGWTKQRVVLQTNANGWENQHVNDPCVVDCPDWGLRVLLYTSGGDGSGTYHGSISVATASLGSTTFTRYSGNPILAWNASPLLGTETQGYQGNERPSAQYVKDTAHPAGALRVWYDADGPFGYFELTYSAGVFTRTHPHSEPLGVGIVGQNEWGLTVQPVDNWYVLATQRPNLHTNWFKSTDGFTWRPIATRWDAFGNQSVNGLAQLDVSMPKPAVDKTGLLRAMFYGAVLNSGWDHNQVWAAFLTKSLRLYSSGGALVKSSCLAQNATTVTLDVSGLTFPYNGTVKLVDEGGIEVSSLALADIQPGDVYIATPATLRQLKGA